MITVRRIMGVETEYALIDRDDPSADPDRLARALLFAYAREAAAGGAPSTDHVPADAGRELLAGAGCRFDYSGELPTRDARDGADHDLAPEARTDREAGAVLTGSPTRWVKRVAPFEAHYYRGSASHAVNGARLYVDHTHPEYASPEALGPREAVLYDKAGDLLMHRAETALGRRRGSRIQVIKNNTDGHGAAWGAHESYAVRRSVPWELLTSVILPFLVTRQVIGGSGRVGIGPDGLTPGFQVFARADYVEQEVSLYTTRERPIVNTRDEPHADAGLWRRLHVITADSSNLAITGLLRTGSMAALLSLVEEHPERARALAERFAFADPVGALRAFSHDPDLRVRCDLAAGGAASALEVQRAFLTEIRAAARLDGAADGASEGPDEETAELLALWGEALDALERSPLRAAHLVEWCAKLAVLERLRARYGCGWDDPRIRAADLQLGVVDPATSLAAALERAGSVRRVVDDQAVRAAVERAPADTRAGGRAAFLRAFPDRVWAASWTSLVVDTGGTDLLRVSLPDPTHPTAAEVERALGRGAGGDRGAEGGADDDRGASLVSALEALGVEIPEEPRTYAWDEGFYADSAPGTPGPRESAATAPVGDDGAAH
ncbi:proteasome accessory factor PafA2 family protein [Actinomyces gerencseriae]|uniref:proteasome accessory factor PafA2 family protein n=1 Tax=Actinomyces gerencseriae TaxID=52769 RepID=UPI0023EFCDD6|nr:proteasome accessory factor PafA2 family protein [Actinomyces gerencseriae]